MKRKTLTNAELQSALSQKLTALDSKEIELNHAKTYFSGANALLKSVRIDIDTASRAGKPMFQRTQEFLGVRPA